MTRTLAMVIVIVAACGTAAPVATQTAAPTITPTAAVSAAPTTPGPLASFPPGVAPGGSTWSASAAFPATAGERFLFQCPPNGSEYAIWGSGTYTSDSSVCTAAVHSGWIDFFSGGSTVIEIRPGQESYTGSEHNGVTSRDYGSWGSSFAFAAALPSSTAPAGSSAPTSAYLQLLTYVPAVIANTCTEIDPTAALALAVANCKPEDVIIDPDAYIDSVVYLSFDADFKTLDAWADRWEQLGEPTGTECSAGPSTNVYTVAGEGVGRIVCGPDPNGGLVAWWYDNRLKVVMSLLLLEGTYEDLANLVGVVSAQP